MITPRERTAAVAAARQRRLGAARPTSAQEAEDKARDYLEILGHGDHPDAAGDPIYALYQIAVDYRCTASGYRALYLHREVGAPP